MILGDLGIVVVIETINTGSAPPAVSLPFVETADERVPRVRHQRRTDEDHQLNPIALTPTPKPLGWIEFDQHPPRRQRTNRRTEEDTPTLLIPNPVSTPTFVDAADERVPRRRPRVRREAEDRPLVPPIPPVPTPSILGWIEFDQHPPRRQRFHRRVEEVENPWLAPPIPPANAPPYVEPADDRVPRRRRLRCREREQDDDGFPVMPTSLFLAYGHIGARQQ